MSWVEVWKGRHYAFQVVRDDWSVLKNHKVVVFSGHPQYMLDIVKIAKDLKGKVVTAFLPEGDVSLYDQFGIQSFQTAVYEAWNACDVVIAFEEDKVEYYRSLTSSRVEFVHVPIDESMSRGEFFVPRFDKQRFMVVYGDNNPNGPLTAMAVANRLAWPIRTVCIEEAKTKEWNRLFGTQVQIALPKLPQYEYLSLLGKSMIHVYPTRWVGSSREPIACAIAGTPCVGSSYSHTMRRLWPELCADPFDVKRMVELVDRLENDLDFYRETVMYAWRQLPFYGLSETKKRFMLSAFPELVEVGCSAEESPRVVV